MIDTLNIVGAFWTIQGEGFHSGRRALFVRMPYCNLKCSWCDTEFNTYKTVSESDFIKLAISEKARFAVITGGEPMMNRHTPRVIAILKGLGFEIACESNGTFSILPGIDFATVSPKKFSELAHQPRQPVGNGMGRYPAYYVHDQAMKAAHEFKYVVDDEFDFSILDRHEASDGRRYSLSPEFNDFDVNVGKIIRFIEKNPGWRISLQTHKWMKVP